MQPKDGIFDDEFRGVGGSYVIDPATGLRVPEADFNAAPTCADLSAPGTDPAIVKPLKPGRIVTDPAPIEPTGEI